MGCLTAKAPGQEGTQGDAFNHCVTLRHRAFAVKLFYQNLTK